MFASDCGRCARLVCLREQVRQDFPDYFAAPVPPFGDADARLLIVGLAPGMHGANRTGRPFTGDYAGDLLYGTLKQLGLADGEYRADPNDGFTLKGVMISNAVRCAPPENKPTPDEIAKCRPFLAARVEALPNVRAILALGAIAHESTLRALGAAPAKFAHGAEAPLPGGRWLVSSYHCSRYNTQTRRLTPEMFLSAMARAKDLAFG